MNTKLQLSRSSVAQPSDHSVPIAHLVDTSVLDRVHDLGGLVAASGSSQDGSSPLVHVVHLPGVQLHQVSRVEAAVSALTRQEVGGRRGDWEEGRRGGAPPRGKDRRG